jgi:ribosomal protein S18 acetylase RimI-like enzyme
LTWEANDGKFLIVHRLCIHPDYQGRGLAKALMQFAEEYALKNGYASIRMDTFITNKAALGLYNALGYRRAGQLVFSRGHFQVFEKVL